MIAILERRRFSTWGRTTLAATAAAILLTGCGGGGGGGNSGGVSTPQVVTITGQLKDKTTANVLPNRTVTIQGTTLKGTSDSQGQFAIGSVPVSSISLAVVDSNGTSDGTAGPIDLSKINGNPRSVGVITLDIYGNGPPAPPGTGS